MGSVVGCSHQMGTTRDSGLLRGASLAAQALHDTFDVAIDHYVTIDLDQLANLIDDVGGVDVQIHKSYDATGINLPNFQPGTMHMGGDLAMAYATAVDTGSIWDGLDRQTEVLVALRDRILSAGMIPRIPELFSRYSELVVTDLSLEDLVALGCLLEGVPPEQIPFEVAGPAVTQPGPDRMLLPDVEAIRTLIRETFGGT